MGYFKTQAKKSVCAALVLVSFLVLQAFTILSPQHGLDLNLFDPCEYSVLKTVDNMLETTTLSCIYSTVRLMSAHRVTIFHRFTSSYDLAKSIFSSSNHAIVLWNASSFGNTLLSINSDVVLRI